MSNEAKTYIVSYIDFYDNEMKMLQVSGDWDKPHYALIEGLKRLAVIDEADTVSQMDDVEFIQDEMFNRDSMCGVFEVLPNDPA